MKTSKACFLLGGVLAAMGLLGCASVHAPTETSIPDLNQKRAVARSSDLQLPVEGEIGKSVDFWIRINTVYNSHQGVIHDAKYIDHIYEVLDFKKSKGRSGLVILKAKAKWNRLLLSVHRKQLNPSSLTSEERKVFELFKDIDEPNKFLNAAHRKRLRFQLGQKDHFLAGLVQSGRFLPAMEEIFKKEGLPVELTRLPFVESSFNVKARSKVGASGIWQFMRSTAQLFIQVNDAVDERNDPYRATEAAAQLLKQNFDSLGSWPLAVTAYNHGRKAMMRAVRGVGSDALSDLMINYRQRNFGFASRNFFPELLAAVEIEKNAEHYFGRVKRAQSDSIQEVVLPDFVAMGDLVRILSWSPRELSELNPGLSEEVRRGCLLIPSGYHLRIPSDFTDFWKKYAQIPLSSKVKAQRSIKYGRTGRLKKCLTASLIAKAR